MEDRNESSASRRRFIKGTAAAGAAAWAAPSILHASVAGAAGTPDPGPPRETAFQFSAANPPAAYTGNFIDTTLSITLLPGDTAVLSSTSDGSGNIFVDDILTLDSDATASTYTYTGTGCFGPAEGAIRPDVTSFLATGTQNVTIQANNACGGIGESTAIWLVLNP